MSFGFGVSDFIAVGTLAWKVYKNVYKAAKDAPESFQKVHHDVLSLHAVLKEAGEIIFDSPMSSPTQQRLRTIADGCTSVLDDLQGLVNRYEEMGTQGKLTWKRFRWGSEDIVEYRLRITSSVTMLNAFMSTSQAVTQQKLEKYLREVQSGRREGSIMSVQTVDSLSKEDRAAWRAIRKDLESIGITAEAYEANHDFIRDWLTCALDAGALDEQAISVTEENKPIEIESSPPLRHSHLSPNSSKTYNPDPEGEASSTVDSRGLDIPKARDEDDTIGLKPSPPRGCSSPLSNLGRAYDHEPDPEGEASSKFDAKGPENPKAGEEGCTSKTAVKNQPVSRVAALVVIISRPRARLLQLARSPVASPELSRILQSPATRRLINAETMERAFLEACFLGSPDSVLKLLEEGQKVNAIVGNGFRTVAKSMIGDDGRRLLSAAPEGASALMLAALHGKRGAIQVLLRWGADINPELRHSFALESGHFFTLRLTMSTPLACAARRGDLDVLQILLDAGANIRQSIHGRTALHEASHTKIVRELLGRGADIHQKCELQGTPLMVAIRYERYQVVKYLINHRACVMDKISPATVEGHRTPLEVAMHPFTTGSSNLHYGAWWEAIAMVDLLVKKGAVMDAQQSKLYIKYRRGLDAKLERRAMRMTTSEK